MSTYSKLDRGLFFLDRGTVNIWVVCTNVSSDIAMKFKSILSLSERQRSDEFRFAHLRNSSIVARGALRVLLGAHLNFRPSDIEFTYGLRGKPSVAGSTSFNFNVSHSGDFVVFAFTLGCEIGIDLEQIKYVPNIDDIADHHFCPEETRELRSIEPHLRERAFFLCWTRKEAYVKAIGDGLHAPLDGFRVVLRPDVPPTFLSMVNDSAGSWTLQDICVSPDYAGAVAYRDRVREIRLFRVTEPDLVLELSQRLPWPEMDQSR